MPLRDVNFDEPVYFGPMSHSFTIPKNLPRAATFIINCVDARIDRSNRPYKFTILKDVQPKRFNGFSRIRIVNFTTFRCALTFENNKGFIADLFVPSREYRSTQIHQNNNFVKIEINNN